MFPISKAAEKGSVIMYLLSDAGQKQTWSEIKPHLTTGKTLYFSHGFSIVFKDQTGVSILLIIYIRCLTLIMIG